MIHRERKDGTLVLRMEHGKVNAIDVELLGELSAAVSEAAGDPAVRAVVLTGTRGCFSAGVDLFRVVNGGRAYLDVFLPALNGTLQALFALPKPVVAAINGHAIAGGCLVACACDYRIMADGPGRTGVPELLVGVPMPAVPMELLRAVLPPQTLQYLLVTGRTVQAYEAVARGIVDEYAPESDVLPRALALAATLGAVPPASFAHTKHALRQPALDAMARLAPGNDRDLAPLWAAPETLEFVRGYLARTVGKGR